MANRQMSSSERKGVLIVAAIALIVTLCGLGVAWCGRSPQSLNPNDVEVLVDGDTIHEEEGLVDTLYVLSDSISGGLKARRQGVESDSSASDKGSKKALEGKKRKKTEKKEYGRRSPLDEPV